MGYEKYPGVYPASQLQVGKSSTFPHPAPLSPKIPIILYYFSSNFPHFCSHFGRLSGRGALRRKALALTLEIPE